MTTRLSTRFLGFAAAAALGTGSAFLAIGPAHAGGPGMDHAQGSSLAECKAATDELVDEGEARGYTIVRIKPCAKLDEGFYQGSVFHTGP